MNTNNQTTQKRRKALRIGKAALSLLVEGTLAAVGLITTNFTGATELTAAHLLVEGGFGGDGNNGGTGESGGDGICRVWYTDSGDVYHVLTALPDRVYCARCDDDEHTVYDR